MNTTTIKLRIEQRIEVIREDAREPSNFLFKKRKDLKDLDWIKRELTNAELIYGIIMVPVVMLIALSFMTFLFLKFNKDYDLPDLSPTAYIGYVLGLLSLIQYANRFQIKAEKLKQAIYWVNFNEDLKY
jgi:hypothetical protein